MKKILVVAIAFVLGSCSQTKIAYIDVQKVMSEFEATIALEEQLKLRQAEMTKELDSLQAPFQTKVQEYYQNADRMSSKKRAETEQQLQQEQQYLQSRQQQASQELQRVNQEKSDILVKRIDSFVADYATANGYKMIMGTSGNGTVMYGDESLNVTEAILEILNTDYSKEEVK